MYKVISVVSKFCSFVPSKGFQAISNPHIKADFEKNSTAKLEALAEVVMSLNNQESQYLNLLLMEKSVEEGNSIMSNKIVNLNGFKVNPIQYYYHQEWIKEEWKDTELLHFIQSQELEEMGQQEEVEVIKEHYDVELTSLDVAQKIKIIKALRQTFNLGLKQAKDFADKVPSMLKKNMKRQQAQKLKKDLEIVGCVITLK